MIRLLLELKRPVEPGALKRAVDTAMRRYPYFAVKLVPREGEWLQEIAHNDRPVVVRLGREAPVLGSESVNGHLLALGYEDNTIMVDLSHAITDGTGLMEFVKTLVYYYVHEAEGVWLPSEGVRTLETPITEEEVTDPYLHVPPMESEPLLPKRELAPDSFRLAEDGITPSNPGTMWRFRIGEDAFLRYSRDNDGSPATMFAVFLAKAIFRLHPELTRDVNIQLARNLRPGFGTPEAHHSLADAFTLRYPAKCRDWSVERLGGISRGMVYLNTDRDAMLARIHEQRALYDRLYAAKGAEEIATIFGGSLRDAVLRCGSVSYVGRRIPRAMDACIEGLYTTVGAGSSLVLEINAVNGRFCCTLMQGFPEDTYIRAIERELRGEGIEVEIDAPEPLILPRMAT